MKYFVAGRILGLLIGLAYGTLLIAREPLKSCQYWLALIVVAQVLIWLPARVVPAPFHTIGSRAEEHDRDFPLVNLHYAGWYVLILTMAVSWT